MPHVEDEMEVDQTILKKERKEKKDKKEKKEKKDKKEKREKKDVEVNADADSPVDSPPKKRKRDALPDEIEIDVSLPEPASKKAARAAKKAKLNPPKPDAEDATTTAKDPDATAKRSPHSVWIGNLPWSATKDTLRTFLQENAEMAPETITRVHMPAPTKPPPANWTRKPLNKGFAYVDFSTELAMYSAIALTETKMDGRPLLIKNAKSFEGRPEKPKTEEADDGARGAGKGAARKPGNPPNKRVFVGNLSFDVSKEDLEAHYAQAGAIEHIHMATFEDSGKCKGYAWVTFGDIEAATAAVKGFVFKDEKEFRRASKKGKKEKDESEDEDEEEEEEDEEEEKKDKKPAKPRKWLLNKLFGRELRTEFAEDSTTRYNKRYGKDKPESHEPVDGVNPARWKNFSGGRNGGGGGRDRDAGGFGGPGGNGGRKKVDPRTIKSGAAHSSAPRASQAIVASQGKKIAFD